MKISEMIKNLQDFKKEHGDLDCWYAVDDEGNDYKPVYYEPSLYYIDVRNQVHTSEEVDAGVAPISCRGICLVN